MSNSVLSARWCLKQIGSHYFGCGKTKLDLSKPSDEEWQTLKVKHVERILSSHQDDMNAPVEAFYGQFFTGDEGRLSNEESPLTQPRLRWQLTPDEYTTKERLSQVAALCMDLTCHYAFDLSEILPGFSPSQELDRDFSLANTRLLEWIRETPYRYIVLHLVRTMVKLLTIRVIGANDVVTDLLSQNEVAFRDCPHYRSIDEYIQLSLITLQRVDRHFASARQMGLSDEEMALADILNEPFTERFNPEALAAVQALKPLLSRRLEGIRGIQAYVEKVLLLMQPVLQQHGFALTVRQETYITVFLQCRYRALYSHED